jgi:mannose/cellobiose epimerase-like protein (N-acyl-D-glucosamine 2-epimerase family)
MKRFLTTFFLTCSFSFAQYVPTSPYLINPQLAVGYVDSCAQFWLQTWNEPSGGFFTNIDRTGNVITSWGTNKNMLTQSRNAYGMVRAYMLTGDSTYLILAEKALSWMYNHAWDTTYGGWYQELNQSGSPINPSGSKTAFYQHYALLGISAYVEATGDTSAWNWLLKGYDHLENYYWDSIPAFSGYFDKTDYNNLNPSGKSFNATVDAVTTHLLYLYLMTGENKYKERLETIAQQIIEHFAGSMQYQAIGFVEEFNSQWGYNQNNTMTIMGHVLKAGWCLARINQLIPDTTYIVYAESLITNVWEKGYDHVYGGPYKDFNRVTGQMLLWGLQDSAKAWWQMEQAVTAGLQMYDITGEDWYLQMADETLKFYMQYFVDHQYGEVYADRTRRGGLAWNDAKGNSGKAGYHSIETGYYTYLYGNLFLRYQPAVLYYNFIVTDNDRDILLRPLAMDDSKLRITQVLLNGSPYTAYNPDTKVLNLPAGTGGHFQVTYEPVIPVGITEPVAEINNFLLSQNYPNPFNPSTVIRYSLPEKSYIKLTVYDALGKEISLLVDEEKPAGNYQVTWNASGLASGIYFYQLKSGNFIDTKKMILVK